MFFDNSKTLIVRIEKLTKNVINNILISNPINKSVLVCLLNTQINHIAVANMGKAKNSFKISIHLPGLGIKLIKFGYIERIK